MTEFKGAPGPWEITEKTGWDEAWCDWHQVVPVSLMGAEANADSRLISAAPELLEALLMLQKQALQSELNSPNHEWGLEALAAARAAIAKALGEQK